jgi:NAD(P)-dependent dehydrogenase (short-subunit alcohol dehydrogenase family)
LQTLDGKVAVVTGGGGGIGRGMALAFADAGMKVAVADVDLDCARAVADELQGRGAECAAFATNVMERAAVQELAAGVYARFGSVHVLCNNAGVSTFGPLEGQTDADWDWVLGVNLYGVVHGLQAFLPRMRKQSGDKHVVNTASVAGMQGMAILGPYVASKFAVVGLTETLRLEGASWGCSASVLCPGNVRTGIVKARRNRPGHLADESPNPGIEDAVQSAIDQGIDPELVGRMVRDAVLRDDLYVFTHSESRAQLQDRFDRILASFDVLERGAR